MKYKKAVYKARMFMRSIYIHLGGVDQWLKFKYNFDNFEQRKRGPRPRHARSVLRRDVGRLFGKEKSVLVKSTHRKRGFIIS